MDKAGDQKLLAKGADGNVLLVLPFPDPVFVDIEAAVMGFLKSDFSAETIKTLANAPKIPAEVVDTVSEILTVRAENVPKPKPVSVNIITDLAPVMRLKLFGYTRKERPPLAGWRRWTGPPQEVVYPCIQTSVSYGDYMVAATGHLSDIRLEAKGEVNLIRRDHTAEVQLVQRHEEIAEDFDGSHPDLMGFSGRMNKAGMP